MKTRTRKDTKRMPGKRQGFFRQQDHGRHRWHHDPEEGFFERGRHSGQGGHHRHGGHHGHERHGLHSGRKLSAADLQLILLALLASRPAHGYELIKLLEDHSHGLYVPSPGAIYPALTYLEEIGYTSVETEGTKKRYSLTEAGQDHYARNREGAGRILNDMERIGAQMAQARQAMESGLVSEGSDYGVTSEELEAARHELRRAQREKEPYTIEEARRIARILQRAAMEIRRAPQPQTPEESAP